MTENLVSFAIGETVYRDGCFSLESCIANQNISDIARRLGLPLIRMAQGVYIAYAQRIPSMAEFELAGVTFDSTDKFVTYNKNGQMQYDRQKFEGKELYSKNAAIPVDFVSIKKQYHNAFSAGKLVKVIPAIPHSNDMAYPAGGVVPQFLAITKLPWEIKFYIPGAIRSGEINNIF